MPQRGRYRRSIGGRKAAALAVMLGCALSACGGGRSSTSPVNQSSPSLPAAVISPVAPAAPASVPSASAPAPASTPVVNIDVYGDDTAMGLSSYGFGMPRMVKPASESLQDALQKQFNASGIQVSNHATGGRAASLMDLLDGMDGGGPPFAQRLASTQSTIVIISYGLNEQYGGESVANFSGYLSQAIQTVRDAGRKPVLETPSPTCDSDHPFTADYAAAIKAAGVAYDVPIVDDYAAIAALPDWREHMDSSCTLPDEALQQFAASQELVVIAPLVQSLIK